MADSFTHLHLHTEFSMLDGAARVGEVVAKAAADGQPAIGITDHGNMYGVLDFYRAAQDNGLKPIIGCELYQAYEHRSERPARRGRQDDTGGDTEGGRKAYYHLTALAESDVGYRNLIQLASRAFMEGYYYKPRVDWETLSAHAEGLIATTGCLGGHVLQSLLQGDIEGTVTKAGRLQDIFGKDNLFVELDLSAENLPVGTRLRVGAAEVVMTAEPHDGCRKFNGRFGPDALRLVQAKPTRHRNLRGVYWRVVAAGEAAVGDAVRVLSRP